MYYYIVYGSVTYATRVKNFFSNESGYVGVVHTPSSISTGGCSYCVKLGPDKVRKAIDLSRRYGFKIRGVFVEREDRTFAEVSI